jgi:hypothetical protein
MVSWLKRRALRLRVLFRYKFLDAIMNCGERVESFRRVASVPVRLQEAEEWN